MCQARSCFFSFFNLFSDIEVYTHYTTALWCEWGPYVSVYCWLSHAYTKFSTAQAFVNCELTHNNLENILSLWIYTERNSMPTRKYHLQTCTKRAGERGGVRERGRSKENIVRRRRHGKEKLLTFHCLEYDFIPANDKLIFNKRELRQSSQHNCFLCIYTKSTEKAKERTMARLLTIFVCVGFMFMFVSVLFRIYLLSFAFYGIKYQI